MMHAEEIPAVLLEGDGIAAVCAARLLSDASIGLVWQPNTRPKLAAILLGEQTRHLLRELFPMNEHFRTNLFEGFVQIKRRIVLWGDAKMPLELPHSGVVAPEGELLRRLWQRVPPLERLDGLEASPGWRIHTSRAEASARPEIDFGSRHAHFAFVDLHAGIAPDACWVESVTNGWLFLLALGEGKATLIGVGDTLVSLLSGSRLVVQQIGGAVQENASTQAYPRLTATLADRTMITCGSAAMSFDPLCGEGAGNAVREAFLAAAVVRASLRGSSRELLGEHYSDRLRRGFFRHLQMCLGFYSTGGTGEFWESEAASMRAGLRGLKPLVEHKPRMHFRLVDRDLLAVQPD